MVDVDWYVESPHPKELLVVDKEKAALHGITADSVARTLRVAVSGESVGRLHVPDDQEDVDIVLDVPRMQRCASSPICWRSSFPTDVVSPWCRSASSCASRAPSRTGASTTRISCRWSTSPVTSRGGAGSPAYAILQMNKAVAAFAEPVAIYNSTQPPSDARPAIKWDGEWHITLELFRDLGAALAVVLLLIYGLLVGWFRSFLTPLVVMAAIPFSLVGILPAHVALGAFFTATSMIGFMAGAGIVVRNSIILVDFAEVRIRQGVPVEQAVVDAGAVRFRPMLLTALAVTVGSAMILFDPIFQGLAISLAAGELASLLISRMAVPVLYALAWGRGKQEQTEPVLPAVRRIAG